MRTFFLTCAAAFCLLLLAALPAHAQEKSYRAVLIDSLLKTPVEGCTVTFTSKGAHYKKTSNNKGLASFSFQHDSASLLFQHIGYKEQTIAITASKTTDVTDTIFLVPVTKEMEEIVIITPVPPIVIRGDTTEYNIDSSMFENFDVVEDLLKRLPGLEIDENGNMKFHGKPINRILVDGEDLFGGDPSFSLKKLPAGMVAKIQVMDTKTLEQLFNNIPSDGEDKTLNIKLKEGNKVFGTASLLAGTRNQAEAEGNLSQYNQDRRITIMGTSTTSNKISLVKRQQGPSSAFTNTSINYGNKFGSLRLNSSYGYNSNSNSNRVYRERTQLITADTSFFTRQANETEYASNNHRFSLNANWFIDSSSTLDMSLMWGNGKNSGYNNSASLSSENGDLRNEGLGNSTSFGSNQTMSASLMWAKRFNRKGRNLTVNARSNFSNQQSSQLNQTYNTYFKGGVPVSGDTLDRETRTIGSNSNYSLNVNFTEPISKALRFILRGDFDRTTNNNDRKIYNLDSATHSAKFDSLYSATIFSTNATQTLGGSMMYYNKKWNVSSGLTAVMQQTVRNLQNDEIRQHLLRYAPTVTASYNIAPSKVIRANFSGTTIQPTIEQLQPVPDNNNPLYIRLGNPNLRTAFSQTYGVGYSVYDTSYNINANINYAPVSNQIMNAVFYDEFRRQTSRYINVDGVYSLRGSLYISRMRRNGKRSKNWGLNSNMNYSQQVFFQSNNGYFSKNYSVTSDLSYSNREFAARATSYTIGIGATTGRNWTPTDLKILNTTRFSLSPKLDGTITISKIVYATLSYNVSYNKINYNSNLRENDEYSVHFLNNRLNCYLTKGIWVQSNLQYQYNSQAPQGVNKGLLNCNLSASAFVFQRRGQFIFTASDLFTPNNNLRRIVGENFIEDVQIQNLRNYFTLKFQYSFNKLDRKQRTSGKVVK